MGTGTVRKYCSGGEAVQLGSIDKRVDCSGEWRPAIVFTFKSLLRQFRRARRLHQLNSCATLLRTTSRLFLLAASDSQFQVSTDFRTLYPSAAAYRVQH